MQVKFGVVESIEFVCAHQWKNTPNFKNQISEYKRLALAYLLPDFYDSFAAVESFMTGHVLKFC